MSIEFHEKYEAYAKIINEFLACRIHEGTFSCYLKYPAPTSNHEIPAS